jgi:hypothetical protein
MKNHWRKIYSFLPKNIERKLYESYFKKEHERLKEANPQLASNYTKHNTLRQLKNKYGLKTLVETGTFLGDTLYSLYNDFNTLYSIELSEEFYAKAKHRFSKYSKVRLIQGDSGKQLFKLVPSLNEPVLFWLDGHYSGGITAKGDKECPVYEELNAIFNSSKNHVIVIDDARLFVGEKDYPTINDLKRFVISKRPSYSFEIEGDSIRLLPPYTA